MFSMSDSNLALPISTKSACNASSRKNKAGGLEIPLWAKPSCPSNLRDYVAVVPLHHANATKYLAAQREHAAVQQKLVDEAFSDADSTDDAFSDGAMTGYITNKSSNETVVCDDMSDDDSDRVSECITTASSCTVGAVSVPELSRTQALVASLRDSRRQAYARRVALDAHSCCALKEEVIAASAGCSNMQLLADLRAARENAASQRLAVPASGATATAKPATLFVAGVMTIDGACHELRSLHSNMLVIELVELVADAFKIPNFAVRLMWDSQILDMSHSAAMPLHMLGIQDGSQLTLVRNFGWGKPDVTSLHGTGR